MTAAANLPSTLPGRPRHDAAGPPHGQQAVQKVGCPHCAETRSGEQSCN